MDKLFVLHHPPLVERKHYLDNIFYNLSVSAEWIDKFDPNEIQKQDNLTKEEYSLLLKHIHCYRHQIENNLDRILILEDDALIHGTFEGKNFLEYYKKCIEQFKKLDCDLMFIGSCCGIEVIPEAEKNVYYHPSYTTRCAHCYVITFKAAKKSIEEFDKGNLAPADWFLNHVIEKHKLKSCYTHPSVYQGSGKVWKSSLR